MGPCLYGLLENFWDFQKLAIRQNGFQGTEFPATRGKRQGGLETQKIFNVLVDNFIRTWLAITVEDQRVSHEGL